MNTTEPLLKIRFDGKAVGPGRIPVGHLLKFLGNLNKAFQRTGRVLKGAAESTKQGRPPQQLKEEIDLDLVLLTEGSPAAVLGFERRQTETFLPQMDFGIEILENSIRGLDEVQKTADEAPLPHGYDTGVLMAWRDAGILFFQGVERIEDAFTGRITSIKIHDIQRIEGCEDKAVDLLPQGTPISRNFWESPTLDELAFTQNVQPLANVRVLFGTWPGEDNDGFEASIDDLRHHEVGGGAKT